MKLNELIWPPALYYVLSDKCSKGEILWSKKTSIDPEFVMIHPDSFEKVMTELKDIRTLVPLKEYEK